VANAYLEGTDSEVYPAIGRDEDGLRALFRHVSSPAAFPVPHRHPASDIALVAGGTIVFTGAPLLIYKLSRPSLVTACAGVGGPPIRRCTVGRSDRNLR
jgi:xylulose-5-phosphate/fructose-6-phosphate phosphoketolase